MELGPMEEGPSWRNPSGISLPALPTLVYAPTYARARIAEEEEPAWRRRGRIVAHAWPVGFTEADYRLLLCGGRARRLRAPDGYTRDGAPLWSLSAAASRQRERDMARHALDRYETHNIACNVGRTALLNFVANVGGLTGIQYFAVGVGSIPAGQTGPQASDTQLWSEFYRQALSSATVAANQVDLSTIFSSGVANTTYTEAGIFGDGATGTANSGVLFAHALYTYHKTSTVVLTNDYFVSLD